jgi:hypothetical protein
VVVVCVREAAWGGPSINSADPNAIRQSVDVGTKKLECQGSSRGGQPVPTKLSPQPGLFRKNDNSKVLPAKQITTLFVPPNPVTYPTHHRYVTKPLGNNSTIHILSSSVAFLARADKVNDT